jgi:peptide/nickel transport system substrate-binding protein
MANKFGILFVIALVIIGAVVILSGCTSSSPSATPTPTANSTPTSKNFTITTMDVQQPESLDPAYDYENVGFSIMQNVYDTLLFYNGTSTTDLIGDLATSYNVSPDGLTYTFNLRHNVTFSNGDPFNASAVKYTFDRGVIMNQPAGSWVVDVTPFLKGGLAYMSSNQTPADVAAYLANDPVQVIDPYTVSMTLAKPYAAWPYVMAFPATSIIDPIYDQANGGYAADNQSAFMTDNMMGTGPFVLTEWVPNDHITLTRNPTYWGTPALPSQVIIKYSSDYNTRLMAVDSGQADIMLGDQALHYYDLLNDTNIKVDTYPTSVQEDFIGMNFNISPFNNPLVRKAMTESFDYNTYIQKVFNGLAAQPNGAIPQGLQGYNASMPKAQFNATDAAALLTQAGYSSSNPFNITIYYNSGNDMRQTAALMLQQEIQSYNPNYKVNIQALDWGTYLQDITSGSLPAFALGWIADYPSADNFIGPFFLGTSQGYFAPQISYNNSEINNLYLTALHDTNMTEQMQDYTQIQTLAANDYPYIYLDQPYNIYTYRTDVHGIVENPIYSELMYSTIYK